MLLNLSDYLTHTCQWRRFPVGYSGEPEDYTHASTCATIACGYYHGINEFKWIQPWLGTMRGHDPVIVEPQWADIILHGDFLVDITSNKTGSLRRHFCMVEDLFVYESTLDGGDPILAVLKVNPENQA